MKSVLKGRALLRNDDSPTSYAAKVQQYAGRPRPLVLTNGEVILHNFVTIAVHDDPVSDHKITAAISDEHDAPKTIAGFLTPKASRQWSQLGPGIIHERTELLIAGYYGVEKNCSATAAIIDSEKWLIDSGTGVHLMPRKYAKGKSINLPSH